MKNESVSSQPMSWSGVFEMLSRVARSAGEVEPDSVADPRVVVLAGAVSSALLAMAQYVNGDESTLVDLRGQLDAAKRALAEVQADLCIERRQHAQQVTYLQTENTRLVLAMRELQKKEKP